MSKDNKLVYFEGAEDIETTGHLLIGFDVNLDKKFDTATGKEVGREIFRQILDGDFNEVEPLEYQILGP